VLIYSFHLFSVHYCVFVMIGNNTHIGSSVETALAPFDEAREVEPSRFHLPHHELVMMAKHFGIPASHVHELSERMEDWNDRSGGVDREGLYYLSTCNPDGRWDWYEIGGRWEGRFGGRNEIKASDLADAPNLAELLPYFLVTPQGEWLEHERHYVVHANELTLTRESMDEKQRLAQVRRTLLRWPDHTVVCVDIHA
jgi:hypothetical protein